MADMFREAAALISLVAFLAAAAIWSGSFAGAI
jgi:hypothetical protein